MNPPSHQNEMGGELIELPKSASILRGVVGEESISVGYYKENKQKLHFLLVAVLRRG